MLFVALAIALTISGRADATGAIGAHLWFWSRVVYVPIYIFGILILSTGIFFASMAGLFVMPYVLAF